MLINRADLIWERLEDFYLPVGTSLQDYERLKRDPLIVFDDGEEDYGNIEMRVHCMFRARVPGGWLVQVRYGQHITTTYVPWSPDPAFKDYSKWKA